MRKSLKNLKSFEKPLIFEKILIFLYFFKFFLDFLIFFIANIFQKISHPDRKKTLLPKNSTTSEITPQNTPCQRITFPY